MLDIHEGDGTLQKRIEMGNCPRCNSSSDIESLNKDFFVCNSCGLLMGGTLAKEVISKREN